MPAVAAQKRTWTIADDLVGDLRSKYVAMFLDSSAEFPRLDHPHTLDEQLKNENELKRFIDDATSEVEKKHKSGEGRITAVEKLKASVRVFVAKSLVSSQRGLESDFVDDFSDAGEEFVRDARALDSHISAEDIHQALRNVWIINSLQVFLGRQVALTPSGFAYSLLYPYTDNYLDNPRVSMRSKKAFMHALDRRLQGESLLSWNPTLSIPFKLIGMIEKEYSRAGFSEVYLSLLAIHRAQKDALAQQDTMQAWEGRMPPMEVGEVLELSVGKGGTSVLADAYLVDGTLEDEVKDFAFGLGVCLQLIDDLQDLEEDIRRGHRTVMSMSAAMFPLDALTNRLINFTLCVIESGNQFHSQRARALLELSRRSCIFLVLEAAARAMNRYTTDYIRALEVYSPLRFSFLKSLKEELKRKSGPLKRLEPLVSA